ncbi:MAG: DUF4358 domain-containing protein [Solobacterium sp.]|nr:DUF4358 domain-containing protein [Erysipelotrichaceae bacterium]MBQ9152391.1 DUF4358 domain-containing protein [Solobacterium sp.]
MLKKFVSSIMAVLLLVGCGSSSGSAKPSTAAEQLVKNLNLSSKMDAMDESQTQGLFFFADGAVKSSSLYLANDKSADIVGVFEAEDVSSVRESVETYLETTKLQNQTYNPEEVFKLDNAVIDDNGKTVVVVVCDDLESAKKEVKSVLGK